MCMACVLSMFCAVLLFRVAVSLSLRVFTWSGRAFSPLQVVEAAGSSSVGYCTDRASELVDDPHDLGVNITVS